MRNQEASEASQGSGKSCVHRVFLSHSSRDKPFVRFIGGELRECGYDPWLDERELTAGQCLSTTLKDAVQHSQQMLVFLSRQSVNSEWVKKEMEYAMTRSTDNRNGPFVPCLIGSIGDDELPDFVRNTVYVDLRRPERYSHSMELLLSALRRDARTAVLPPLDADRRQYLLRVAKAPGIRRWVVKHLKSTVRDEADATKRYWAYLLIADLGGPQDEKFLRDAKPKEDGFALQGIEAALEQLPRG